MPAIRTSNLNRYEFLEKGLTYATLVKVSSIESFSRTMWPSKRNKDPVLREAILRYAATLSAVAIGKPLIPSLRQARDIS